MNKLRNWSLIERLRLWTETRSSRSWTSLVHRTVATWNCEQELFCQTKYEQDFWRLFVLRYYSDQFLCKFFCKESRSCPDGGAV